MGGCQSHNFPIHDPEDKPYFKAKPKQHMVNCSVSKKESSQKEEDDLQESYIVSNGIKVQIFKNNFWDKKPSKKTQDPEQDQDTMCQSARYPSSELNKESEQKSKNQTPKRKKSAGFVQRKRSSMSVSGISDISKDKIPTINNDSGLIVLKSEKPTKKPENTSQQHRKNSSNLEKSQTIKPDPIQNSKTPIENPEILNSLQSCSSTVSIKSGSIRIRPCTPNKSSQSKLASITNKPIKILHTHQNLSTSSSQNPQNSLKDLNQSFHKIKLKNDSIHDFDQISFTKDSTKPFQQKEQKTPLQPLRNNSLPKKRNVRCSSMHTQSSNSNNNSNLEKQYYNNMEKSLLLENASFISQQMTSSQLSQKSLHNTQNRPSTPQKRKILDTNTKQQQQDPWQNIQKNPEKNIQNLKKPLNFKRIPSQQQENTPKNPLSLQQRPSSRDRYAQQPNPNQPLQQLQLQQQQQQQQIQQQQLNHRNFKLLQEQQQFEDSRKQLKEQIEKKKQENAQKLKELKQQKRQNSSSSKIRKNSNNFMDLLDELNPQPQPQQPQNPPKNAKIIIKKQEKQQNPSNLDENTEITYQSPAKKQKKPTQKPPKFHTFTILEETQNQNYLTKHYPQSSEFELQRQNQENLKKKYRFFPDLLFFKSYDQKSQNFYYQFGCCNLKQFYETRIKHNIKWQNRDQDLTYILYSLLIQTFEMWSRNLYFSQISMEDIWFQVNQKEELRLKFAVLSSETLQTNGSTTTIEGEQKIFKNEFERLQSDLQQIAKMVLKIMISTYPVDKIALKSKENLLKNSQNPEILDQQFAIFSEDYLKKFLNFLKKLLTQDYDQAYIEQQIKENQEKIKPIVDKTNNTWKKSLETQKLLQNYHSYPPKHLLILLNLAENFQLLEKAEQFIQILSQNSISQDEHQQEEDHVIDIKIAQFYQKKSKFGKSQEFYSKALPKLQKIFSKNSLEYTEILRNLAQVNLERSDYTLSEQQFLECEQIYSQILDKHHSQKTAQIYQDLAHLYLQSGNPQKSEEYSLLQIQILQNIQKRNKNLKIISKNPEISRQNPGQQQQSQNQVLNKKIMEIYNSLGTMYQNMEDMESSAEKYFNMCLEIQKNQSQVSKEESEQIAVTLQNLAMIAESQGKYPKAEKLYLEMVSIVERICSGSKLAQFYQNLGRIYFNMNQTEKSDFWYKKSHTLYMQNFGDEDFQMC